MVRETKIGAPAISRQVCSKGSNSPQPPVVFLNEADSYTV